MSPKRIKQYPTPADLSIQLNQLSTKMDEVGSSETSEQTITLQSAKS
jgi:hypothetical protein